MPTREHLAWVFTKNMYVCGAINDEFSKIQHTVPSYVVATNLGQAPTTRQISFVYTSRANWVSKPMHKFYPGTASLTCPPLILLAFLSCSVPMQGWGSTKYSLWHP